MLRLGAAASLLLIGAVLSDSATHDEWQELSVESNMLHAELNANKQQLPLPYAKWMVSPKQ